MQGIQNIVTKDGKQYKISLDVLKKYSNFFKIFC